MKLPVRLTWILVEKAVDGAFALAIAIDRGIDAWKARKPKGLSFKDVQHQQEQIRRATRASAKTVVLPGREKP